MEASGATGWAGSAFGAMRTPQAQEGQIQLSVQAPGRGSGADAQVCSVCM